MTDLEYCRRLLDEAIQQHAVISFGDQIRCYRVAKRLRAAGLPEGARSIEDRMREHGGLVCEHGERFDRYCDACGL